MHNKPIPWGEFAAVCERDALDASNQCANCHCLLQEMVSGRRKLDGKFVCSDCYFDALSDFVEEAPVQSPRVRRG
jgi:hypothetical protein